MELAGLGSAVAAMTATGSAALTAAWIAYARRQALHDLPGRRRLHEVPTPRGGGIAIAISVMAALAWLAGQGEASFSLLGLVAGIAAFAAVGLLDDLLPMPSLAKLLLQLAAAAVLVALAGGSLPLQWLAGVVLVVGCAYFVNVWNFMDGSNGLVSIQALLIALALALWPGQEPALRLAALAVAGSCLGFLPFNFPRARVFLGDVGSHAMGAAVFALLWLSCRAGTIDPFQAAMLASAVLFDSGFTLVRRVLAGRIPWRAHREHLYQYAVRRGHGHARVALIYGAWTVLMTVMAGSVHGFRSSFVSIILIIFSFLFALLLYWRLRRRWLGTRINKDLKDD